MEQAAIGEEYLFTLFSFFPLLEFYSGIIGDISGVLL